MKLIVLVNLVYIVLCGEYSCDASAGNEDGECNEGLLNLSEFYDIVEARNDEFTEAYNMYECDQACDELGIGSGQKWNVMCVKECREYKDQPCIMQDGEKSEDAELKFKESEGDAGSCGCNSHEGL